MKISIFWFRRDLRLEDNVALFHALHSGFPVLPIFIFDENILQELPKNDARVNFIYNTLIAIHKKFIEWDSSLLVMKGDPYQVWEKLISKYEIHKKSCRLTLRVSVYIVIKTTLNGQKDLLFRVITLHTYQATLTKLTIFYSV